jgi:hypothetical protein
VIASSAGAAWAPVDAPGDGGWWPVCVMVTWHVLFKTKTPHTETFLLHTKASSCFMTHTTHRSVPVYRWFPLPPPFFFFFFGGKWQFQPTENSLCVNWRFILCLTELKLRRLCLISETKGNYTPVQKLVNPLQTTGRFSLLSFLNKELCGMSWTDWKKLFLGTCICCLLADDIHKRYLKNTWSLYLFFFFGRLAGLIFLRGDSAKGQFSFCTSDSLDCQGIRTVIYRFILPHDCTF